MVQYISGGCCIRIIAISLIIFLEPDFGYVEDKVIGENEVRTHKYCASIYFLRKEPKRLIVCRSTHAEVGKGGKVKKPDFEGERRFYDFPNKFN